MYLKADLQTDWHYCFNKTTEELFISTYSINYNKETKGKPFNEMKWKDNIPIYNNVYYFLTNSNKKGGANFFHFNFHHLQRLIPFIKNNEYFKNTKIITSSKLLDWQNEILYHLIGKDNIIQINFQDTSQLILKDSYYVEISDIHNFNNDLYEYMFKRFHIQCTFELKNIVFISKHKENIGSVNRKMLNEEEFKYFLNEKNIQTIEIHSSVHKKHLILKYNPRIIIMEFGSSVVNLLYIYHSSIIKIHFIFLVPSNWYKNLSIFTNGRIFSIIKFLKISYSIIVCKQIEETNETDILNYPYNVDIQSLQNTLIQYDNAN